MEREYGRLPDECRRYFIIRCIIDLQVRDVVTTTEKLIRQAGVEAVIEVVAVIGDFVGEIGNLRFQ